MFSWIPLITVTVLIKAKTSASRSDCGDTVFVSSWHGNQAIDRGKYRLCLSRPLPPFIHHHHHRRDGSSSLTGLILLTSARPWYNVKKKHTKELLFRIRLQTLYTNKCKKMIFNWFFFELSWSLLVWKLYKCIMVLMARILWEGSDKDDVKCGWCFWLLLVWQNLSAED